MNRSRVISCLFGVSAIFAARSATSGQSISKADTPLKVADVLDCFVQKRFEKGDERLGVTRMVSIIGHTYVRLFPETPEEKKLLAAAKAAGRPYLVSFLHCDVPPSRLAAGKNSYPEYTLARKSSPQPYLLQLGMDMMAPESGSQTVRHSRAVDPGSAELVRSRWQSMSKELEPITKRAVAEIPRLKQNRRVDFRQGDLTVALRPVIARNSGCISCHTQSKQGDTLGVMVYAVSNKIANPSSSAVRTARMDVTK